MRLSLEFLGTGTSVGVPVICCDCAVCTSTDPRNKRLRSSAIVRGYDERGNVETSVIIDTGPDFRQQMLRANIRHVDAFITTHFHSDHVCGIDDVRRYNFIQKQVLDLWATTETLESLRQSFGYVFVDELRWGWPCLRARTITHGQQFNIGCLSFESFDLDHAIIRNTGLRISCRGCPPLAYCLDVKTIPDPSFESLRGTDTLVLDMLREAIHPTHMNLEEALAAVTRIQPRRAIFGHIAHEADHATIEAKLPSHVRMSHDGMLLVID